MLGLFCFGSWFWLSVMPECTKSQALKSLSFPLSRDGVLHQERPAGEREGWSNAASREADRQVLSLPSLPGITLPVWLIPRGSLRVSLLQPNSLVPISSSEAALSLCYISDWTCRQHLFSRGTNPFQVLAFKGDNECGNSALPVGYSLVAK